MNWVGKFEFVFSSYFILKTINSIEYRSVGGIVGTEMIMKPTKFWSCENVKIYWEGHEGFCDFLKQ